MPRFQFAVEVIERALVDLPGYDFVSWDDVRGDAEFVREVLREAGYAVVLRTDLLVHTDAVAETVEKGRS